ncbi:hypothetical protein MNBD_GAMMA12-760 [hydrothermal vent metagenome]|uniref:WGR domain-containing protein n=1 Tax=hydrothermal vent metagenome TaxID=652676 RepID=A0A3B0YHB0_9ZZZZ
MKLVKQAHLYFKNEKSDKVYEVDLCELAQTDTARYLVNFRYGRRGANLKEGSKTDQPVTLDEAQMVFDSIVVAKTNKGYLHSDHSPVISDIQASVINNSNHSSEEGSNQFVTEEAISEKSCLPDEMVSKIKARLASLVSNKQFDSKELKRLVWRIGELEIKGLDNLLLLAGDEGDALLDYCLIWTLGRVGQDSKYLYPIFARSHQLDDADPVKRIALEAMLQHASEEQRCSLLNSIKQRLDPAVNSLLDNNHYDSLFDYVKRLIDKSSVELISTLTNLYCLSIADNDLRTIILKLVPLVPARPNALKALRYIYKAAEFRNDYRVLGLVALVMERSQCFARFDYYDTVYIRNPDYGVKRNQSYYLRFDFNQEMAKEDSRIAWTANTRHYFIRRTWRNLRRLGKVSHPQFVDQAVGILLAFSDKHGDHGITYNSYRYFNVGTPSYLYEPVQETSYEFAPYMSFNNLLYAESVRLLPSASGDRWYSQTDLDDFRPLTEVAESREELLPELWDKRPDALIQLLCESQCLQVHLFAVFALRDNQQAYSTITTKNIIAFLATPYDCTNQLAKELAVQRYNSSSPDVDIIVAMLAASIQEARDIGRSWLMDNRYLLDEYPNLLVVILTAEHKDMQGWGRELVATLKMDTARKQAVVARLFAWMQDLIVATKQESSELELSEVQQSIIIQISWYLTHTFSEQTESIGLHVIEDLLKHPALEIKKMAAHLLVNHKTPTEQLPTHLLKLLIENENVDLRALGVQLFGKLPAKTLASQSDLILTYCLGDETAIRKESYFMIARIAEVDSLLAGDMIRRLLDELFRKESSDELHADIINALSDKLSHLISTQDNNACVLFDKDIIWRLLMARANGANQYGGVLLEQVNPEHLTVRQWSRLGMNPVFSVRAWVWDCYQKYGQRIKNNSIDALRILENSWDDSRAFAIDYFRTNFSQKDWSAESMIGVCDSVLPEVQQLGRELITRFFSDDNGVEYLSKLSQHPSVNIQLFTSHYLKNYAGGSLDRIEALAPYFVTVLSNVNKGRIAKTRVIDFLYQEAMQSADVAKIAAKILSRQSVTIVLCDHTRYLLTMRDLLEKYPFLDLPINKKTVPVRSVLTNTPVIATEKDQIKNVV